MKKLELTPRLQAVASFVPKGARLADIGTDHAYLPVYLLLKGQISGAVAADIHKGPLDHARQTAEEYGCTDQITFRLCNGLKDVKSYETDAIAIAGMGGETIIDILSGVKWVKEQGIPVVLQPMSRQPELRRWLWQNGYVIEHEVVVQEGDTLYVVISARPGQGMPMTAAEEWAGRQWNGMDAPLREQYFNHLLDRLDWVMKGIAKSREGEASPRYQELLELREGLTAMQKEWMLWQS